MLHEQLSKVVIGCFLRVYHNIGYGSLEAMYQRALVIELRCEGLEVETEVAMRAFYRGVPIGDYRIDLIVEDLLLVECKACDKLVRPHELQVLNYLNATRTDVGLLFNFGPQPSIKRLVCSNTHPCSRIFTATRISKAPSN